jgi:mannitol/fructose-specific phosphotransferase system IIA component (Ntr-type)
MRMSDFVVRDAIIPALTAVTKEGVIREMVDALRAAGQFRGADQDDVVRAILHREELATTGIGRGIAIPHAKHQSVERLTATVALSPEGIDFKSVDTLPVHVVVLLISPKEAHGLHLRALEAVSRRLRDDGFVRALRQAKTKEEIISLLERPEEPAG